MNKTPLTLPKILVNILVFLFSLTCIFPIIWIGYTSFKTLKDYDASIISLPRHFTVDNYAQVLKHAQFSRYFLNSMFVSVMTLCIVIVLAFISGYFLSRFRFRGRNIIYYFLMLGMVVPTHAWMLPVFIQFRALYLQDRFFTLVFPYVAFGLPIAVFLMESFIKSIPTELEESSTLEGCTVWTSMRLIILPLCRPIISTVLILTFNTSWNEFPFALVLINRNILRTIPVALTMFTGAYTTNYPQMVAALSLSIIPIVLVYAFFSKQIVEGLTAGAVKG